MPSAHADVERLERRAAREELGEARGRALAAEVVAREAERARALVAVEHARELREARARDAAVRAREAREARQVRREAARERGEALVAERGVVVDAHLLELLRREHRREQVAHVARREAHAPHRQPRERHRRRAHRAQQPHHRLRLLRDVAVQRQPPQHKVLRHPRLLHVRRHVAQRVPQRLQMPLLQRHVAQV